MLDLFDRRFGVFEEVMDAARTMAHDIKGEMSWEIRDRLRSAMLKSEFLFGKEVVSAIDALLDVAGELKSMHDAVRESQHQPTIDDAAATMADLYVTRWPRLLVDLTRAVKPYLSITHRGA